MRIYNYNKKPSDSFRGAKIIIIEADKHVVSPASGLVIRKAPGDLSYDFG